MKALLLLVSAAVAVLSLIISQLKMLKKHHPNAEMLIGLFKILKADQKTPGGQSNG